MKTEEQLRTIADTLTADDAKRLLHMVETDALASSIRTQSRKRDRLVATGRLAKVICPRCIALGCSGCSQRGYFVYVPASEIANYVDLADYEQVPSEIG